MGIMGNTHGVNKAASPNAKAVNRKGSKSCCVLRLPVLLLGVGTDVAGVPELDACDAALFTGTAETSA
jgi:hypothetical protein